MNRSKVLLMSIVLITLSMTAAAQVWLGIPQFSADMKMSVRGGEGMGGKMFFGGQRMRYDMNGRMGEASMIIDSAKQTNYMLMHAQKMYMEMNARTPGMGRGPKAPDAKPLDPSNPCSADDQYTCKKVGTETVNGRSCDKWEFTGKSNPGDTRTVWLDQKLHFPIKSVGSQGDTFELTNVKEGPQDAALFQVPAGYQKFDMGGMMGQRPPQN